MKKLVKERTNPDVYEAITELQELVTELQEALKTILYSKQPVGVRHIPSPPITPRTDRPFPEWDYNQDKYMYRYASSDGQTKFVHPDDVPSNIRDIFEKDRFAVQSDHAENSTG